MRSLSRASSASLMAAVLAASLLAAAVAQAQEVATTWAEVPDRQAGDAGTDLVGAVVSSVAAQDGSRAGGTAEAGTPGASEAPAPCADAVASPDPLNAGPCPLDPGIHEPRGLLVPIRLGLNEGWTRMRNFPGTWVMVRADDILGYLTAPFSTDTGLLIESADAFVAYLLDEPRLEATEPEATTVGGRPATVITVTGIGSQPFELQVDNDRFFFGDGDRARVIVGDMDGTAVAITIEGYGEGGLEGAVERTQAIIDSIEWGVVTTDQPSPEASGS